MLKVFGFVRRHPRLTHDEYRAAHVGYHNSFGRRLNGIRGYLLNVASNTAIESAIGGSLNSRLSWGAPDDFDEQWDGWGQLMFDTLEDYLSARAPARDYPGPNGLQDDPMVAKVGGDFDYLYAGSPFQFHVDEHIVKTVRRPERKLFKLAQFFKRKDDLPPELFRAYLTGRYATLAASMPGLRGMTINIRTPIDVMSGFFATDAEGFTPAGIERREKFYESWDGMCELWFDSHDQFVSARDHGKLADDLLALEKSLFAGNFYREVDETVAVLPKRDPAPDFYHR